MRQLIIITSPYIETIKAKVDHGPLGFRGELSVSPVLAYLTVRAAFAETRVQLFGSFVGNNKQIGWLEGVAHNHCYIDRVLRFRGVHDPETT